MDGKYVMELSKDIHMQIMDYIHELKHVRSYAFCVL